MPLWALDAQFAWRMITVFLLLGARTVALWGPLAMTLKGCFDDDHIRVDMSTDMGLTMHMASPSLGRAEAHRSTSAGGRIGLPYGAPTEEPNRSFRFSVMEGLELVPATATVRGPVTGGQHGRPFSLPLTDLGSVGYLAEEFFVDGTAAAYEAEPGAEFSVDGKWRVLSSRTAPFRTRLLVVRPVDMTRFNGVVYVNWQNVTAGFELGIADAESEQLLEGFAWVGCLHSVSEWTGSLAVSSSRCAAGIRKGMARWTIPATTSPSTSIRRPRARSALRSWAAPRPASWSPPALHSRRCGCGLTRMPSSRLSSSSMAFSCSLILV